MFESIVLYENKTVSAVATPELGNKIQVTLTVNTAKRKADGSGNETPMALNDLNDVGVSSGTKKHLKPPGKAVVQDGQFDGGVYCR
jgi:hypothetical protein